MDILSFFNIYLNGRHGTPPLVRPAAAERAQSAAELGGGGVDPVQLRPGLAPRPGNPHQILWSNHEGSVI